MIVVRPLSININGVEHHTVQGSKVVLTCDVSSLSINKERKRKKSQRDRIYTFPFFPVGTRSSTACEFDLVQCHRGHQSYRKRSYGDPYQGGRF